MTVEHEEPHDAASDGLGLRHDAVGRAVLKFNTEETMADQVTRWKCILCGSTSVRKTVAEACEDACRKRRDNHIVLPLASANTLTDIQDQFDHEENNRPVTGGGPHLDKYPADEPRVDPFDCLDDNLRILADVVLATPTAEGMVAVYAAGKLISALREERQVLIAACKRLSESDRSAASVCMDKTLAALPNGDGTHNPRSEKP